MEQCEDIEQEIYEKTIQIIENDKLKNIFNVSILELSDFGDVLLKAEIKDEKCMLDADSKMKEFLPEDIRESFKVISIQEHGFIFEIYINL